MDHSKQNPLTMMERYYTKIVCEWLVYICFHFLKNEMINRNDLNLLDGFCVSFYYATLCESLVVIIELKHFYNIYELRFFVPNTFFNIIYFESMVHKSK